jgi:hypothetical protein
MAARWEAFVVFAIAACQVNTTSAVQVDASSSVHQSGLTVDCRPRLTTRCAATDCGHICNDDMQIPTGHLVFAFNCESTPSSCAITYTTCDPDTQTEDPPPAPVTFGCGPDHCGFEKQPITCVAAPCGQDCDANVRAQVPTGFRVTAATCNPSPQGSCSEDITVCDPNSNNSFPMSTTLSCPTPCGETRTQIPCATTCGHSCAADVAAQMGPGERITGTGCILTPSGQPTECQALLDTCDGNGNEHHYSSHYDDPCCGDPCCGDACCGDPCCGDPCCGDPCCGDPFCCGDPCCGDPCCDDPFCCGDPCCGDPCCGDPCCGDECCGDPCCGDPECCEEFGGCGYGFQGPAPGAPRSASVPRREGPASSLHR